MVASGLQPGMTAVAPLKLALHLTTASLILAGLVWLAAGLRGRAPPRSRHRAACAGQRLRDHGPRPRADLPRRPRGGSKAGLVYNTWPTMDGDLVPPVADLFAGDALDRELRRQPRPGAVQPPPDRLPPPGGRAAACGRRPPAAARAPAWPAAPPASPASSSPRPCSASTTLLLAVPLWAALAHQVFAMAVLTMATVHARVEPVAPSRATLGTPSTPFGFESLSGRTA